MISPGTFCGGCLRLVIRSVDRLGGCCMVVRCSDGLDRDRVEGIPLVWGVRGRKCSSAGRTLLGFRPDDGTGEGDRPVQRCSARKGGLGQCLGMAGAVVAGAVVAGLPPLPGDGYVNSPVSVKIGL
ncbi:hypothetical protein CFN17_13210 [Arthrobacter sp. PM3]|nr:hypothetical protein CFN17_13210 [Arthrobacter sp. PM3]